MESVNISLESLSRLTNIDSTELAKALTNLENGEPLPMDEASSKVCDLVGQRISKVGDDQHKRGRKEALTSKEREIAKLYNIQAKPFAEMFDELISKTKSEAQSEFNSKQAPNIQILEDQLADLHRKIAEKDNLFETQKTEFEQRTLKNKVVDKAFRKFMDLNPNLSEEESTRELQIQMFKERIAQGNYKLDGDSIVILDSEGNVKKDKLYSPVTLDDHVAANNFLGVKQNAKPNIPNPPRPTSNNKSGRFTREAIEGEKEYAKQLAQFMKDGDKAAANELYQARKAYKTGT